MDSKEAIIQFLICRIASQLVWFKNNLFYHKDKLPHIDAKMVMDSFVFSEDLKHVQVSISLAILYVTELPRRGRTLYWKTAHDSWTDSNDHAKRTDLLSILVRSFEHFVRIQLGASSVVHGSSAPISFLAAFPEFELELFPVFTSDAGKLIQIHSSESDGFLYLVTV